MLKKDIGFLFKACSIVNNFKSHIENLKFKLPIILMLESLNFLLFKYSYNLNLYRILVI